MSLVGTRPPTVDEWEKYELHHRSRMSTKPGITGMWQVSGRSDITDFEEVVRLDTEYIEHWTIGLDIKILIKTVLAVVKHEGSVQLYLELFVAFICLRQISKLKRFKNQTFVIGIFCMMIMVSSFFNKNKYDGANIEKSLVFALAIIEVYLYAQLLVVTQRIVLGVKMVYIICCSVTG